MVLNNNYNTGWFSWSSNFHGGFEVNFISVSSALIIMELYKRYLALFLAFNLSLPFIVWIIFSLLTKTDNRHIVFFKCILSSC